MSTETLLVLQDGAEIHRLYLESVVIGRSRSCDVSFDQSGISRRHCEIVLRDDGILLRDLGSTHGTYADGDRVPAEAMIRCGTVVRLGQRGPRLRVIEARLGGRALSPAGGQPDEDGEGKTRPVARAGAVPPTESAAPHRPDPGALPSPADVARAAGVADDAPPAEGSGFGNALALGVLVGVVAGVAALALLDLSAPIAAAREALGVTPR